MVKTIELINDFEKDAEDILEENIAKLGKNQEEDTPISGENNKQNYYDDSNNRGMGEYAGQCAIKGDVAMGGGRKDKDNGGKKKSYEYEERRGKMSLNDDEEYSCIAKSKMKQQMEMPLQRNEDDKYRIKEDEYDFVPEGINEDIPEDVLNEQSNDKKSGSNNTQTVSQSIVN